MTAIANPRSTSASMGDVVVVRTGTANLASVLNGLGRVGVHPRLSEDPQDVITASHVVLPGVGAFAAAMDRLTELQMVGPLAERIRAGRPTLCICLGLQLLAESSAESPGCRGLAVIEGQVTRLPDAVRVPQIGWNRIEPLPGCRVLSSGFAYFANTYRLSQPPVGWHAAIADHGGPLVAAIERGSVLACQFHPELSGPFGQSLLRRWLDPPAAPTPDLGGQGSC